MLRNWLKHPDKKFLVDKEWPAHTIGYHVEFYEAGSSLEEFDLAIIGIGDGVDEIRAELFQLSFLFKGMKVVDLGNSRKTAVEFVIPLIREVLEIGLFPIILGHKDNLGLACFKAFTSQRPLVSLGVATEKISVNKMEQSADNYLSQILSPSRIESQLFHFVGIGCQTHFLSETDLQFLEEANFDCIRLGRAKRDPAELEPVIRDTDVFNFHLDSIRFSDAPGQIAPTPSGFSIDHSCLISRYAGMSDKLRIFSVLGFQPDLDIRSQTAATVAQLIWYFMDGFYNRKHDFPVSNEGLIEYLVEMKSMNYQMAFWKSQKSGRWWMQIPIETQKQYERHCLIPCSYSDYKMACNNELPDRLLNALKRFG